MKKILSFSLNFIFSIQVLLAFLWFFEDRIILPSFLQVVGRSHVMILHFPISLMVMVALLVGLKKEFPAEAFEKFMLVLLLILSLSSSVTALAGLMLSVQEDYNSGIFFLHKRFGILFSFLCYFIFMIYHKKQKINLLFLIFGGSSFLTVFLLGHSGGVLTHGSNFIFEPMFSQEAEPLRAETATLYEVTAKPIFEKKCFSCHNENKKKGELIMTNMVKFQQGGENGSPWVAGKPEESLLMQNIHLPVEDDHHMPPDGKPQLSQEEVAIISLWIKRGSDVDTPFSQWPEDDSLKLTGLAFLESLAQVPQDKTYSFQEADPGVIQKLNTPYCTLFPLFQNSPALQADIFVRDAFDLATLKNLEAVQDQLVVLNLSNMPVQDEDLKIISKFSQLEELNLNFTSITGKGIIHLGSLAHLKKISLAGTPIRMEDLNPILQNPSLSALFAWNTDLTEKDRELVKKSNPNLMVFLGDPALYGETLKLTPPQLVNEGVIMPGEKVALKHAMPGVTIRYTLDGINPDSVSGIVYTEPFFLGRTETLKAIAVKDSWYSSNVFEGIVFVRGMTAKSVRLLTQPDPDYLGDGVNTLFDGKKGYISAFKDPAWLGYRDTFVLEFHLEEKDTLSTLVLSMGRNLGSYIFPPEKIELWGGDEEHKLKRLVDLNPEQPGNYKNGNRMDAVLIPLPNREHYQVYQLVVRPLRKIPDWHGGKGEKGWAFFDEVFFY